MHQDFSIWEYETYQTKWEICIIGSGISGLSAGISILGRRPQTKIIIVDRWFIPLGASTRNAGFSCFGSPSEILDDISQMGETASFSLVSKRWEGMQLLKSRLDLNYVRYETNGGYELYQPEEFEKIKDALPSLNTNLYEITGQKEVFRPVSIPSGIRGFSHAIYNPFEGQLHPGFMIEYLRQMFLKMGGRIWTGLDIEKLEDTGQNILLSNKLTIPVRADKVVVTTNAFSGQLLPELQVFGARNHVLVTQPVPGLAWKGCFHYDKGYYYFRNIGNRILLGGARNLDFETENTNHFGKNEIILEALEQFLYDHLASREIKIDFQWSGIIGIGPGKLPIVKAISPRLFVGVRLSGMGIALASLIGEQLTDMVLQQWE